MRTTSRRLRHGVALLTPIGLTAAGLLAASPAQAAAVTIDRDHIDTADTRATGHVVAENGGLHVFTEGSTSTDKAAGYFDAKATLSAAASSEPTMTLADGGSGGKPGMQLVVDFDRNGNFDAILVGEPGVYGMDWWAANSSKQFVKDRAPSCTSGTCTGGSGSAWHGTLAEWNAAFPGAVIYQAGFSLGSGVQGDWTIREMTVGANSYTFVPADYATEVLRPSDIDETGTTAGGSNTYSADGVTMTTETWDDLTVGMFDPRSGERLRDIVNPAFAPAGTGGKAGLKVELDIDNDGTTDGALIYESVYGGNWWLTSDSSTEMKLRAPYAATGSGNNDGQGSEWYGRLAEWRAAFGSATVLEAGWVLGVPTTNTLSEIKLGETTYTISAPANTAPTAANMTVSASASQPKTIALQGADADGDALTYAVTQPAHGTVTVSGGQATYTADRGFTGTDSFTYTVSDGKGGTATGTVTVKVWKATTDLRFANRTNASNVSFVTVTVVAPGAVVDGGTVQLKKGTTVVATKTVTGGKADFRVGVLRAGSSHTYTAVYSGTSTAKPVTENYTFTKR